MPLPAGGNTPWPPPECEQVYRQLAVWSAWYSGDAEQLHGIYSGDTPGTGADTTGFFASESGGWKGAASRVMGAVRRWFWGSRTAATQQRTRLHVPLAGDIAAASADLLFSDPPTITVEPAQVDETADNRPDDPTQARLDELVDDGMIATLLEGAEVASALGGVYLRVVWDKSVRDRPWITAVHPDAAVPTWRWGRLDSVIFWKEIERKGRTVVRHLECHERGKISHGVYMGDADTLGQPVPLTDHPATAGLASEQLENGNEVPTGHDRLTAVYVPNVKPNRIWRNTPAAAHYGRSDYQGVEPLMDALDLVYSSWIRDVDLGKSRIILPREYLENLGRGQGATVDLDRELYEPLNSMSREDGKTEITQVQFKIRVEEHSTTVDALKTEIVGLAGYSAQTFGLADKVAVTATEVNARKHRSVTTRGRKIRYWRPELADILEALLHIDARVFGTPGIVVQKPMIEFPPAVSPDPEAVARELRELHTAEAISTEEKVRKRHPDWGDPEVDKEVEQIKAERGGGEDPEASLGRLAGNQPPGTGVEPGE